MSGKLKAVILLGLLYGLGLISGFAWQRYCFHRWPMRPGPYAEHRVERLKRKLNLTPDQEKAINAIFQKAHERAARMNEKVAWDLALIHRDSIAAIRPLLTPEQLVKFERLHEKYHGRHPNLPLDSEKQPPPQDSH